MKGEKSMTRRKRLILWIALVLLSAATVQAGPSGDARLILGQKSLTDDVLDDAGVDGQTEWGVAVTLDFDWPVALTFDLMSSSEDSTVAFGTSFPLAYQTDVDTMELGIGVRKYWGDTWKPFAGGGLAFVDLDARQTVSGSLGPGAEFTDTLLDDSDSGLGFWAGGGVLYQINDRFSVGVDVRYTDADVSLSAAQVPGNVDIDSGGIHYAASFGYHW